ncbi:hypothetical protein LWI29_036233 [Acer saccharum]|uniref:RNase H type-1 domain-containing protein n=1 Tax=Acer saccharum TaxID=4024 RepID=A0AA39SBY7_ACESA|nr:hypothetical protein LWI29_036233 [Acer saccharum]
MVQEDNLCLFVFQYERSCIIKFDGCCKGNPGRGGAGAVLRSEDGDFVLRLWEGVGDTTSNVAEYRAVILGLKYALDYNFEHICVQGDSMIVCKQIPGEWQVRNKELAMLCEEARQLKNEFGSFEIEHIHRQPASPRENFSRKVHFPKRFKQEAFGSTSSSTIVQGGRSSGILNFDGCSKGNPGKAGAGAVLRPENGSWKVKSKPGGLRCFDAYAEGEVETRRGYVVLMLT